MKLTRAYTAEPVSEETVRRLKMGRTKTRLIGLVAAGIGALTIPAWIAGIGMGYFKLEDKTIAVFPSLLSEEEAKAQAEKVSREAEAFRQQKATEEKKP